MTYFVFNGCVLHITDNARVSRCGFFSVLTADELIIRREALYAFIRGRRGRRFERYHLCGRCFTKQQQNDLIVSAISIVSSEDLKKVTSGFEEAPA